MVAFTSNTLMGLTYQHKNKYPKANPWTTFFVYKQLSGLQNQWDLASTAALVCILWCLAKTSWSATPPSAGYESASVLDQVIQLHEICMNLVCFRAFSFCQTGCKKRILSKYKKWNGKKAREREWDKASITWNSLKKKSENSLSDSCKVGLQVSQEISGNGKSNQVR